MTKDKVKQVVARVLNCDVKDLNDSSGLLTQFGWDSLAHIEIITSIEDVFGIKIEDSDISVILTIEAISKYINSKLGDKL